LTKISAVDVCDEEGNFIDMFSEHFQ
jgi:hypothetical protein